MQFAKKLNLLPKEHKNKNINKYLYLSFGSIVAILILIQVIAYINIGIINMSLTKLEKENKEYNATKSKITSLESSIKTNKQFIDEYNKGYFPFYRFMDDIQIIKPYGVTILSIDSLDRLKAIVPPDNIKKDDKKETAPSSSPTPTPPNSQENDKLQAKSTIAYTKDLSGEKLDIRGFGDNQQEISAFIYDLSNLPYINGLELKGIEEHTFNSSQKVNVFEVIIQLK